MLKVLLNSLTAFIAFTLLGCILAAYFFVTPILDSAYREATFNVRELDYPPNTVFTDRYGKVMRFLPNSRGERREFVPAKAIPRALKNAFIAAEDERFYTHDGYDPVAICRAGLDNYRSGRIVSGASTISQQLVRMSRPRGRNLHDKLVEMFRSVKMEEQLSKDEILERYLNRVPMGNNIVGVGLASTEYFGKPVAQLSIPECALLASLPKAPTSLNPVGGGLTRLTTRRNWVLGRMKELGYIDEAVYAQSVRTPVARADVSYPYLAPHLVDMLEKRGADARGGLCRTTIDLDLQTAIEKTLTSHKTRLSKRGAVQAAAIVIKNSGMDALALAGSMDYANIDGGYNNGATSLRSAGSTLKPFLYALALERGYTASDILNDTERKYRSVNGTYSPANFDRRQYGPVTMRMALGSSLNLAAVNMLVKVGPGSFYKKLNDIDLINDSRGPGWYGLGLAVGNPEVSLEQLAASYAMLANSGQYRHVRYLESDKTDTKTVYQPETAYIITDILADPTARSVTFGGSMAMEFPFRVAIKTGTSTGYRDCWAVGYTPEYTIAVWVGNFDGRPSDRLSGSTAAVPIFYDILGILYGGGAPSEFKRPPGVTTADVCGYSGMMPSVNCRQRSRELFIKGTEPVVVCSFHDKTPDTHTLPAAYASWLDDKRRKGAGGGYRIADLTYEMGDTAEDAVGDSEEEPPVRQIGASAIKKPAAVTAAPGGRHTIGPVTRAKGGGGRVGAGNRVQIIYPLEGDRFVSAAFAGNRTIRLLANSDEAVDYIEWYVDGRQLSRSRAPYQAFWEVKKGRHRITAVDPQNGGSSVTVVVE